MCYSLASGVLLNELVLSPLTSVLQARLTRHILMNIYEDVGHSQMGFSAFYRDGKLFFWV